MPFQLLFSMTAVMAQCVGCETLWRHQEMAVNSFAWWLQWWHTVFDVKLYDVIWSCPFNCFAWWVHWWRVVLNVNIFDVIKRCPPNCFVWWLQWWRVVLHVKLHDAIKKCPSNCYFWWLQWRRSVLDVKREIKYNLLFIPSCWIRPKKW